MRVYPRMGAASRLRPLSRRGRDCRQRGRELMDHTEVPRPPVAFLHGFGTSFEQTWVHNGWVDLLGDIGRESIGIDLLGHGRAPKPHDPAAYADLEERVLLELPDEPV